jgi:hypothetical protein
MAVLLLIVAASIPLAYRLSERDRLRDAEEAAREDREERRGVDEPPAGLETPREAADGPPRIDPRYRFDPDHLDLYRSWIRETVEETRSTGRCGLVVDKAAYELAVFCGGDRVASFPVELGANPFDDKRRQGDGATPEGKYSVARVRDRGETRFHRALLLDYPSPQDRLEYGELLAAGLIEKDFGPGGLIEIHGEGPRDPRARINWTLGCVAVANENIDRIFDRYAPYEGMPVTIVRYGSEALH